MPRRWCFRLYLAWHGWERLGWLADIAGLLVRHPGVMQEAEKLTTPNRFIHRALLCACGMAGRIFGPPPGVRDVDEDPQIDQALELLMRDDPAVSVKIQRQIHHQLMRSAETLSYTVRRLATPGDPDFKQGSLPPHLRGLYWSLRPVRYLYEQLRTS